MIADRKPMCKFLRLAYVHDTYEDIPYQNTTQFLEDLFQKELQLREEAKAERLIKKGKFLHKKSLASFLWNEKVHVPFHTTPEEICTLEFIQRKKI